MVLSDTALNTLISAAGVILSSIISAIVSWLVARHQARVEFEKQERAWRREDDESFADDFHTCCRCVQNYLEDPTSDSCRRWALRTTQTLRGKAPASMTADLRKLHTAIESGDVEQTADLLDRLIDSSRKARR